MIFSKHDTDSAQILRCVFNWHPRVLCHELWKTIWAGEGLKAGVLYYWASFILATTALGVASPWWAHSISTTLELFSLVSLLLYVSRPTSRNRGTALARKLIEGKTGTDLEDGLPSPGRQWPQPSAILLPHYHGGLPFSSYLNPGTEEPLFTILSGFVGVSVLWTSSLQLPPGALLNSLLACTTPYSQECFSYLFSRQGSWQIYSESKDSCNLEQGSWKEGLGFPSLSREEGGS